MLTLSIFDPADEDASDDDNACCSAEVIVEPSWMTASLEVRSGFDRSNSVLNDVLMAVCAAAASIVVVVVGATVVVGAAALLEHAAAPTARPAMRATAATREKRRRPGNLRPCAVLFGTVPFVIVGPPPRSKVCRSPSGCQRLAGNRGS